MLEDVPQASAESSIGVPPHVESNTSRDAVSRIRAVRRLIDESYSWPGRSEVTALASLARAAAMSPHHFHRLFRREVGETPLQYVTRRRVEQARRLLVRTELSVTDVCFEVGFHSLGSFSSLFRRYTGRAPTHYRRALFQSLGVEGPRPLLAAVPGCFLKAFRAPR